MGIRYNSRMQSFIYESEESHVCKAWTRSEILEQVGLLFDKAKNRLPKRKSAKIVIKPNLNNDLNALTGNSVDLRVLDALVRVLKKKGYTNITIADGPNVGIERRGIDVFSRLGIRKLCALHEIHLVDLNADLGVRLSLSGAAQPKIAQTIRTADFLISVPKIKTHCEAQLSCAMKNWVGICVGQDKRHMHLDLGLNIAILSEHIQPDLILVDGIVGMEGNGPGDGQPRAIQHLLLSSSLIINDLIVSQLVGLSPTEIPYLVHAIQRQNVPDKLIKAIQRQFSPILNILRPPPRSRLAILSETKILNGLKLAVRPLTARPEVLDIAYRFGVVQDVYDPVDATVTHIHRDATNCGDCNRCEIYCPVGIPLEEIGSDHSDCLSCLQCWWVCPNDALIWEGERGHLQRHKEKYSSPILDMLTHVEEK